MSIDRLLSRSLEDYSQIIFLLDNDFLLKQTPTGYSFNHVSFRDNTTVWATENGFTGYTPVRHFLLLDIDKDRNRDNDSGLKNFQGHIKSEGYRVLPCVGQRKITGKAPVLNFLAHWKDKREEGTLFIFLTDDPQIVLLRQFLSIWDDIILVTSHAVQQSGANFDGIDGVYDFKEFANAMDSISEGRLETFQSALLSTEWEKPEE